MGLGPIIDASFIAPVQSHPGQGWICLRTSTWADENYPGQGKWEQGILLLARLPPEVG